MADSKLQFLLLICCVNNVLSKLSSHQKDWTYITKAFTFYGEECVSDCEYSQCIVNFEGEMRACYTTNNVPFVFYTSQASDPNSTECMSNCKKTGKGLQLCVTKNGVIEYCNSSPVSPTERSSRDQMCITPCKYNVLLKYYACYTGSFHDYCAPPASERPKPDNSKTSAMEKPQNCPQTVEKPVTQTCPLSTEQPNQKQCNCDCKNNAEYNKKDIYFKIEANIPHEIVDKVEGNQYHFTINFHSKTSDKEKGNSESTTEKPIGPGREDNNEHTDQTTDSQDHSPYTKPNETVSEHPSTNNEDNKQSDEIGEDMVRSNFGQDRE